MLNEKRFKNRKENVDIISEVNPELVNASPKFVANLDLQLSKFLVPFLKSKYSFFSFVTKGELTEVFFGDWYRARKIGLLDSINVRFYFEEEPFQELKKTISLLGDQTVFLSDVLNTKRELALLSQSETDDNKLIENTKHQLLISQVDDTLLKLEKKELQKRFVNFEEFEASLKSIYAAYLEYLDKK